MALSLASSVGSGGTNQPSDVKAIQTALQRAAELTLDPRLHPGDVTGLSGNGTEGAIEHFQRRIGTRKPDARIDAGGATLARLNALLAIGEVELTFPFEISSTYAYHGPGAEQRAFGSRRSGGARAHAGVDLYFPDFTGVHAIADGVVTREAYSFYHQTMAIEVDHGAFVARYCELAPESKALVRKGDAVTPGQRLGRVGVLTDGKGPLVKQGRLTSNMLHFEMYDKTASGPLNRAAGTSARHTTWVPFLRRRDLIDPSGFMKRAPLPS